MDDYESFQKLLGILNEAIGISVSVREKPGETAYPIYRDGKEIATIFFERRYVEFRDEFSETVKPGDNLEFFLRELRRQGYRSNYD